ncbi:MAG: hypothetical protein NXH75_02235 [Halobacteriovoraceae bacterium]|nr:hypothetical protein [Halobacteriovoraceae bacterium]
MLNKARIKTGRRIKIFLQSFMRVKNSAKSDIIFSWVISRVKKSEVPNIDELENKPNEMGKAKKIHADSQ